MKQATVVCETAQQYPGSLLSLKYIVNKCRWLKHGSLLMNVMEYIAILLRLTFSVDPAGLLLSYFLAQGSGKG